MQNEKNPENLFGGVDHGPSPDETKLYHGRNPDEGILNFTFYHDGPGPDEAMHLLGRDDPLPTLSHRTLCKYILGIVKNEGFRSTSPLSTKIDFVKDSLNETGISVSIEEIETVLHEDPLEEDADNRASRQAVLGIFLALALHRFQTEKGYWARAVLIKKAVFGDTRKRKQDRIHEWLKIAAAEVVRH